METVTKSEELTSTVDSIGDKITTIPTEIKTSAVPTTNIKRNKREISDPIIISTTEESDSTEYSSTPETSNQTNNSSQTIFEYSTTTGFIPLITSELNFEIN